MQSSLILLILTSQCPLFDCHFYYTHLIEQEKSWKEAQEHCRTEYVDLATVEDVSANQRLLSSARGSDAWIGLYSLPGNRAWHWSLPGTGGRVGDINSQLAGGNNDKHDCVTKDNEKWRWDSCSSPFPFVCFNDTHTQNKFHSITKGLPWLQAQEYCRENYTDLTSGINQTEDQGFQNVSQGKHWIGLFRDNWMWSDGHNSPFRTWTLPADINNVEHPKCAFFKTSGKWSSDDCDNKKHFLCYDDLILIKENKTWVEALEYCRENHRDLISITDQDKQEWVQESAKTASSTHVWLGLRYTCTLGFWFWVSDEVADYWNWASNEDGDDCNMSGAMNRAGGHKWSKHYADMKFNFICSK